MNLESARAWAFVGAAAAGLMATPLALAGEYALAAGSIAGWVGMALNFLVKRLNNGKMPVRISSLEELDALLDSKRHDMADESTKLVWLADIIPLGANPRKLRKVSIGDFLIIIGAAHYLLDMLWLTLLLFDS